MVEVLVSSVILAVAAIGVALMLSTGHGWVVAGGDNRVAQNLARQKIEQLRSLGFSCVPLGGPEPKPPAQDRIAGELFVRQIRLPRWGRSG